MFCSLGAYFWLYAELSKEIIGQHTIVWDTFLVLPETREKIVRAGIVRKSFTEGVRPELSPEREAEFQLVENGC